MANSVASTWTSGTLVDVVTSPVSAVPVEARSAGACVGTSCVSAHGGGCGATWVSCALVCVVAPVSGEVVARSAGADVGSDGVDTSVDPAAWVSCALVHVVEITDVELPTTTSVYPDLVAADTVASAVAT